MKTGKRLVKYSGISLGVVLVMALVLVQPTLNQANAVGVEGLPGYDDCLFSQSRQPEDPISMNTIRSGNIIKTIHAEKEIFSCLLDQGNLTVSVDVTTYIEIYENIEDKEVIQTNALATTCLKEPSPFVSGGGATVIDCESYIVPSTPVPVGSDCLESRDVGINLSHPLETNTVNKGKIAKTIEAQKEVFLCFFNTAIKKVDVILFTDIYEDLSTQEVVEVQFHAMRCVVLLFDQSDNIRDATVETCQFSTIEN